MSALDQAAVVARLKQLPSLPSAISGVLASFSGEDVAVEEIAAQIARDQGLTARVLRVANSSFYGLQSRVGTINDAVVVLGFRAVRSMVLAVGMTGSFRVEQCPAFDAAGYLRHGIGVGLIARALAPVAEKSPDLAFAAGLLHDVGQLVLASAFSAHYAVALAHRHKNDCSLLESEREVLGIDHAAVGGWLAETWHFPLELLEGVAGHHAPAALGAGSLANLVHVADGIAHALGLTGNAEELVLPVDGAAWQQVGASQEAILRILPGVEQEFEQTCQAIMV